MTETVLFDVGGKKYKTARSLLNDHPETMLARMASQEWNPDAGKKLFIERDGERFRYVLDYLRDGKAILPIDVSKEALLIDMEFYGINVRENDITVQNTMESLRSLLGVVVNTRSYFEKEILESNERGLKCRNEMFESHKRTEILKFAKFCFEDYVSRPNKYIADVVLKFNIKEHPVVCYQDDELLKNLLSKIGLELSSSMHSNSGIATVLVKKIKN
uniref:Potassium channel tetramerisation-type BTB domain-containing protein n=1 Tax=Corethron hystrix TaxID=216773 RepID=A0A7S1FYD7_9STRA|mmetsp:Transcript_38922/g.90565  ORF Transcript_38922/g.90565 Transcript_38922/m.90565 type:complete len:217 (+) Transcript_38922:251-901(+)|eukprot:CAMPEP_0113314742 /NCGR_PEP_ID=MMETSP0010_2-20120614/10675_1 /TAXON_ID=216773 ORGANISM="Corethron hystrix, Strain 308" /NCGR_SAMPLE_ID=MMETSP0010_2 /ASSEMBLY_ACC=CAM_ASM_000155 /LENGTH=216 /DNA_ID=CAMNT_0000171077 /DNA_START=162 /DNA_END=812 /DNA_ORIENTATION=- /assembly_acc=CAM_ASM_000155